MTFLILRLLSLIYMAGAFLVLYNVISYLTFSKGKTKVREALKRLIFVPLWPVSIFSKEGRDKLFGFIKKF